MPQNVVDGDRPEDRREDHQRGARSRRSARPRSHCPADPGARGWPATAYSPRTGILYLPLNEFCSTITPQPLDPGQAYTGGGGAAFKLMPVPNSDGNFGRVDAIKLSDQSTVWSHRQRAPTTSAVLPTGGGVVFARRLRPLLPGLR